MNLFTRIRLALYAFRNPKLVARTKTRLDSCLYRGRLHRLLCAGYRKWSLRKYPLEDMIISSKGYMPCRFTSRIPRSTNSPRN